MKCEICKKTPMNSHIHHINGNHEDNRDENVILLCMDCHSVIHKGFGNNKRRRKRTRTYRETKTNIKQHSFDGKSTYLIKQKLRELRRKWFLNKNNKK